jgi:hypothetical protein
MTNRAYLKCDVCNSVTIIRVQVGWLDWHPIHIPCGNCGILISGIAKFDQKKATTAYEFKNASEVNETEPNYYLEVSAELLTDKLRKFEGGKYVWSPPPFFQALWAMGEEAYSKFKERTLQFLHMSENDWPAVRRINELWINGQTQYLAAEVHKYLPKKQFPMNNEAEMVRGVHQLNLLLFSPILDESYFPRATKRVLPSIHEGATKNIDSFLDLLRFFVDRGLLKQYERKLLERLEAFTKLFRSIIPAFAMLFYKTKPGDEKGLTTTDFEALKHYYSDTYEVLSEVSSLVLAFNNLLVRNDFSVPKNKRADVLTLEDFMGRSKGERLQFFDGGEPFDDFISTDLDNKLRNAIAHNSYKYDPIRQDIAYFPSGVVGKGTEEHISLLEFASKCWRTHQMMMDVAELMYQTAKYYFVLIKGQQPVDPSVFGVQKRNYGGGKPRWKRRRRSK